MQKKRVAKRTIKREKREKIIIFLKSLSYLKADWTSLFTDSNSPISNQIADLKQHNFFYSSST